jgi:hypothetical protein
MRACEVEATILDTGPGRDVQSEIVNEYATFMTTIVYSV